MASPEAPQAIWVWYQWGEACRYHCIKGVWCGNQWRETGGYYCGEGVWYQWV